MQEQTIEHDSTFSIPKLSPDGSNWVTFRTRFLFAMDSHDIKGHFDGSTTTPSQPTLSSQDEKRWTVVDKELNDAYLGLARKWQCNKKVAHTQLAQVVPDSLLIHIQHARSTTNMWYAIITEFDKKGHIIQVDLCCKMMDK